MSKLLYIFLATYLCLTAQAATADKMRLADDAYRNADYHKAAALYRQQLTDGASATVYYNLGNAIETVESDESKAVEIYNTMGQKVAKATKGIYLINGKKVLFK